MPQHVLVVTLGPVQDFIASARRCQDLWFGSWLLSDLSRAVAKQILSTCPAAELVFPHSVNQDEIAVANKIVAVIPANCNVGDVAAAGKSSMQGRLDALAKQIFEKLPTAGWDRDLAERQLSDLIEYIWAAAPIVDDYATARAIAEGLLGARKNTKNWSQASLDGAGRVKCSIDGERESVIPESVFEDKKLLAAFFLKKSERLCGVCLLKRVGEQLGIDGNDAKKMTFHSNSHVAAGPVFARMKHAGDAGKRANESYVGVLKGLKINFEKYEHLRQKEGFEGSLLFEDRLREAFESYAPEKTDDALTDAVTTARIALKEFLDAIDHVGLPVPYYAMLLADGDQMGNAIKELQKKEDHQRLSAALEEFALNCGAIVKEHEGSFIYSGGDDVLALLPLHTALACADELWQKFDEHIRKVCPEKTPTLSVGLGIAHHLEAMTEVRVLAKDAEKLAKVKRNSLAIVVSKRSGGTTEVTGKWDEPGSPLHARIEKWCTLFAAELLPDGVAFELEEAVAPFEISDEKDKEKAKEKRCHDVELREVIRALVKRILGRKRAQRGNTKLDPDTLALLQPSFPEKTDPIDEVKRLSAELQIARLFLAAHLSAGSKERQ